MNTTKEQKVPYTHWATITHVLAFCLSSESTVENPVLIAVLQMEYNLQGNWAELELETSISYNPVS